MYYLPFYSMTLLVDMSQLRFIKILTGWIRDTLTLLLSLCYGYYCYWCSAAFIDAIITNTNTNTISACCTITISLLSLPFPFLPFG